MTQCARPLFRTLVPALLLLASLAVPAPSASAAADPSVMHIDGYLQFTDQRPDGAYRCLILRQHDGSLYALAGDIPGLLNGDHVRLEGRAAPDRCGAHGYGVTTVQTIWADDNHKATYYDHLHDGSFHDWAARNNRLPGRR
jgi:hypothetical protein